MDVKNIQFTKIELKIVKYIFKHYKEKLNSRQLAKLLHINHAHANTLCNSLAQKFLLKKEELGNARYYSFDYENEPAIKFMEYLLILEEKEFPQWLSVAVHSITKFKSHIALGLVFGSSIKRKDFNDIDVLLVYDKNKRKEVSKIKEEIRNSQLVEQPIRYVDVTEDDILRNKDEPVTYAILSDNLIVHNPQKYVEVIKKCHR